MSVCPKVMQGHSLNSLPPYTQLRRADGRNVRGRRRVPRRAPQHATPPWTTPTDSSHWSPASAWPAGVCRHPRRSSPRRTAPDTCTSRPRHAAAQTAPAVEEVEEVGRSEGVEGAHVEAQHAAAASREPRRPVVGASAGGGPFGPCHGSQAGGLGARATHVTCVKWR